MHTKGLRTFRGGVGIFTDDTIRGFRRGVGGPSHKAEEASLRSWLVGQLQFEVWSIGSYEALEA